jgi:putative SOS response-associated peptidase YedK
MCGRFALKLSPARLKEYFGLDEAPDYGPRYNIAPSTPILAIRQIDRTRRADLLRWGLVPRWSKGPDSRYSMINARAETVHQKPAYRGPFRYRRCLIPAEAFYEWKPGPGGKQPYAIRMKSWAPFALAGVWDSWAAPDGSELETCSIIVTDANELLRPIHERMPVILAPALWERWLDAGFRGVEELRGVLAPYDAAEMETFPVSRRVNSLRARHLTPASAGVLCALQA